MWTSLYDLLVFGLNNLESAVFRIQVTKEALLLKNAVVQDSITSADTDILASVSAVS